MKLIKILAFALAVLPAAAKAQYGYDDTDLNAIIAKVATSPGRLTSHTTKTYYIRKPLAFAGGNMVKFGSNSTYSLPTASGGGHTAPKIELLGPSSLGDYARIIHGVGVSSNLRWRPLSQLGAFDPYDVWEPRFGTYAMSHGYYVDLDDTGLYQDTIPYGEGLENVYGGWPHAEGDINFSKGEQGGGEAQSSGASNPNIFLDVFSTLMLDPKKFDTPWTVSLDYEESGPTKVQGKPLRLAQMDTASSGNHFAWDRMIEQGSAASNFIAAIPTVDSGPYEDWRARHTPENELENVGMDERCIVFSHQEYDPLNCGVVSVTPGFGSSEVELAVNPFSVAGSLTGGFDNEQRFVLMNFPEFMDEPGEMVISYHRKRIYFIPYNQDGIVVQDPEESGRGDYEEPAPPQTLNVSLPWIDTFFGSQVAESAFVSRGTQSILIDKVMFDTCAGDAVKVTQPGYQEVLSVWTDTPTFFDVVVSNSKFNNIGACGGRYRAVNALTMDSCVFTDLGGKAIEYDNSDPSLLAEPLEVRYRHHASLAGRGGAFTYLTIDRTGTMYPGMAAIQLLNRPAGFVVIGCTLTDVSSVGLGYSGTLNEFYGNTFTNCLSEVGDFGAVYSGRSLIDYGNYIHDNVFQDMPRDSIIQASPFPKGLAGVMLDDGMCGQTVEANVFDNCDYGIILNGGRGNLFLSNNFPSTTKSLRITDFTFGGSLETYLLTSVDQGQRLAKPASGPLEPFGKVVQNRAWMTTNSETFGGGSDNWYAYFANWGAYASAYDSLYSGTVPYFDLDDLDSLSSADVACESFMYSLTSAGIGSGLHAFGPGGFGWFMSPTSGKYRLVNSRNIFDADSSLSDPGDGIIDDDYPNDGLQITSH